jgi:hypothetical protein
VAVIQIALHQTDPHGKLDIAVHAITLDPVLRRLSAFVQDMALEVACRGSNRCGDKSCKSSEAVETHDRSIRLVEFRRFNAKTALSKRCANGRTIHLTYVGSKDSR